MRKGNCGTCHFEKNLLEEEPCNRCDDNNSEWKSGKIYFAIEELEKIKEEIEQCYYNNQPDVDGVIVFKDDINNIFNKRISELKGENNEI